MTERPGIGGPSNLHVLLATWLGELFDGMDASICVLVLFPALSELVGSTSHSTVGLIGSVILATFMLGWALGAIVFGILADYIGRARTLVLTILLYALCTAAGWITEKEAGEKGKLDMVSLPRAEYCPKCYSSNVAYESGCSGPTCHDCGFSECS